MFSYEIKYNKKSRCYRSERKKNELEDDSDVDP